MTVTRPAPSWTELVDETSALLSGAAGYLLGVILGRPDASRNRRQWGAIVAGAITVCILLTFVYFYPIFSAGTITYE